MDPYAAEVTGLRTSVQRTVNTNCQKSIDLHQSSEITFKDERSVVYKRGYFGDDDEMLGRLMMSFAHDKVNTFSQ